MIKIKRGIRYERLFKKNKNYDLLIPVKYNTKKIIYNNRDHILENICEKFLELYNKYKNIQDVTLTSAVSLDKSSLEKIKSKLKTLTTRSVSINQKIDSNIIGGFILKVDDKMYDASYRTKLKNIKKTLLNN